ncbi:cell wall-binding repeat-containing protein [Sutcliffiella cohnii]|uniref:cell wall-binding repeat-containing protein n=1 Tax=Sutcliffiella cohnii TaxID=33932 RepID=UPI002E23061C|nr:cell wall-binding repeat-containing protein [Sutcliffiella cohnii]
MNHDNMDQNDMDHEIMEEQDHQNHGENTSSKEVNRDQFAKAPAHFNSTASDNLLNLNTKNITRLDSNDPFEMAVLVSQTIFPSTHEENQPGTVILVPLDNWQMGLASANLIHHPNNGPILFITEDEIPSLTKNEIDRLNPIGNAEGTQVMVMGDVNDSILSVLENYKVETIQESDVAKFAASVDEKFAQVVGGNYPESVIVVSSEEEAKLYSLVAANWIAHMNEPILYVTKDDIPEATIEALSKRENAKIYLLGPERILSSEVEQELSEYGKVTRIAGDDAVTTSISFASFKDQVTNFGWGLTDPGHGVSFISTETPNLAIAGAPFSHLGKHAPIIWLENGKIDEALYQFLATIKPTFTDDPTQGSYNHGFVLGTLNNVSYQTQGILDEKLEIVSESGEGHGGHGGH